MRFEKLIASVTFESKFDWISGEILEVFNG